MAIAHVLVQARAFEINAMHNAMESARYETALYKWHDCEYTFTQSRYYPPRLATITSSFAQAGGKSRRTQSPAEAQRQGKIGSAWII